MSDHAKKILETLETIDRSVDSLGRKSHAGAVMLIAAALDRVLEETLATKLVKLNSDTRERLFGEFGTLRHFSAKINLALALGLADGDTFSRLTTVRKIRNLFAHADRPLSFESQEVRELLTAAPRVEGSASTIADFIAIAEATEASIMKAAGLAPQGLMARLKADR